MKATEVALLTVSITAVILVIVIVTVACTAKRPDRPCQVEPRSQLLAEIQKLTIPTRWPPKTADFPVDFVYTWVDGGDAEWRRAYQNALPDNGRGFNSNQRLPTTSRPYERDELFYSIRFTLKNLPFVRNIFIVTQRPQSPFYLKDLTPERLGFPFRTNIVVVHHDEFFHPSVQQPTFNSNVIESQIVHIADLSEYYIYSNDDCFILKPMVRSDFFTDDGVPCTALEVPHWVNTDDTPWATTLKKSRSLTAGLDSVATFRVPRHVQRPLIKAAGKALASLLHKQILGMEQFRGPNDFLIQFIELNLVVVHPQIRKEDPEMFHTSQDFIVGLAKTPNLVQVCINADFTDAARRKLQQLFYALL
jgi:hypothetical protein